MRGLRPLRLPAHHPNFSMPPEADGAQAARLLRLPTRHPSAVTVVGGLSLCHKRSAGMLINLACYSSISAPRALVLLFQNAEPYCQVGLDNIQRTVSSQQRSKTMRESDQVVRHVRHINRFWNLLRLLGVL